MAKARVDMESSITGTQQTVAGLDAVAKAADRVEKSTNAATGGFKKFTPVVKGYSSVAMVASASSNAFAQLMRGNLVGAARSATIAIKGLWAAMLSNPITAIVGGFAALATIAVSAFIRMRNTAKESAKKAAEELERVAEANKKIAETAELANKKLEEAKSGYQSSRDNREGNTSTQLFKKELDAIEELTEAWERLSEAKEAHENAKEYRDIQLDAEELRKRKALSENSEYTISDDLKGAEDTEKETHEKVRIAENRINDLQQKKDNADDAELKKSQQLADDQIAFEKQSILDGIDDKLKRLRTELEGLETDLSNVVGEGVDADRRRLEINKEIHGINKQISQEIKSREKSDADAKNELEERKKRFVFNSLSSDEQLRHVNKRIADVRKGPQNTETENELMGLLEQKAAIEKINDAERKKLQLRVEQYKFSKMTTAEQLKEVDSQIKAVEKGPRTIETGNKLMDLVEKRDTLKKQLEKENGDEDGGAKKPRTARHMRGGMSFQERQNWVQERTRARFDASRVRQDSNENNKDKPLEVKGVDKTNQLLEKVVESLT